MTRRGSIRLFVILSAVFVVLIFLNYLGRLDFAKNFVSRLFSDEFVVSNDIGTNLYRETGFLMDKKYFLEAYDKCVAKSQEVDSLKIKSDLLVEENEGLKKLIGFRARTKIQLIPAKIIGRNFDGMDKSVMIDQGSLVGVAVGQSVIVGDGILVGKISKTEDETAFVRLISDNQNKVAATILNKDRSLGVVEGGYGISVRMNFIPRNETIMIGELVITSGLEPNVPKGLAIGTVAAIENEAYQPFQQAVLTPSADLSKLSTIAVLVLN
ncbi:rod shape-determining protein MreC [Patescibacteria group bacterium]|nr:rod shape-determining protein MreC [Patescibacteria group bacterium]